MANLPKIVSPPLWYGLFWVCVFLPAFGVTCYVVARLVLPLYEEAAYRAQLRALRDYGAELPLLHKVGE